MPSLPKVAHGAAADPLSGEKFPAPYSPNPSQFRSARSEGLGERKIGTLTESRRESSPVHGELRPQHPGTPAIDSQIHQPVIPVGGLRTPFSMRCDVPMAILAHPPPPPQRRCRWTAVDSSSPFRSQWWWLGLHRYRAPWISRTRFIYPPQSRVKVLGRRLRQLAPGASLARRWL